jgi:hypothetical protein
MSSLDSAFFLAAIITGTFRVDLHTIHVSIDEATFLHRDTRPYTGSVELTSISADLMEYDGDRPLQAINKTSELSLDKTTRPGERVTVQGLQFQIARTGAEQLDWYTLAFQVNVRELERAEPDDRGGFVVVHGAPDMFAGLALPPAMSSDDLSAVRSALARTRTLDVYELTLHYISHDGTPEGAAGDAHHGQTSVDYRATIREQDAQFTLRGQSLLLQGLDPDQGLEVINVNGRIYAHGPLPLPEASAEAWYDMSAYDSPALKPWYTAPMLIDSLMGDLDPLWLTPDRRKTFDGQSCAIFRGGRTATLMALMNFGGAPAKHDKRSIEDTYKELVLRTTEFVLWVCDDGYVHQLTVDLVGAPLSTPEQTFGLSMRMQLTDVNGAVTIIQPDRALPFVPKPTQAANQAAPIPPVAATVIASNDVTVYATPMVLSERVDQIAAGETVALLERTRTGVWYRVTTERNVTGWVSVVHLPIDQDSAARVPLAE